MRLSLLSPAFAGLALILATAAGTAQTRQPAVTVIAGTLLGADGAPMKVAHVHLLATGGRRPLVARAQVESDGRFALATVRTGAFRLEFTGVDHYSTSVPLLAAAHTTLVVNARLKRYAYADSLDHVTALGDWNHHSFRNTTPLVRQSDGRYTATVSVDSAADSVAYELIGLEASGSRSINGTMSDRYVYDEGGDYRSVIAAHGGQATIVLDPSQLGRSAGVGDTTSVVFADRRSQASRIAQLWSSWLAERQHWQDSLTAAAKRREAIQRVNYDLGPSTTQRTVMLRTEHDAIVRQLILLQTLDLRSIGGRLDASTAKRIVREIPPTSPWWAFFGPPQMAAAFAIANPAPARAAGDSTTSGLDSSVFRPTLAYLGRVAAEHPDSSIRASAQAAVDRFTEILQDGRTLNAYYAQLTTGEPPDLVFYRARYSPNRIWQAGREVPAFQFVSLDDSGATYTNGSLAGKFYLIDFWATWCGPCVGEMKYLHAAHDSLASRGLEILSISLDRTVDDVRKFRLGEWKMPWHHALAPGGFFAGLQDLEIFAIPRVILVGRDGKIIAVDEGLRGEELVPTLRRALEAQTSQ